MAGHRARQFHAFCIGLPKTGTTSAGAIFELYRSAKFADNDLKEMVCDREDGKISTEKLKAYVLKRESERWLEMNSCSENWPILDVLEELFPSARFLLPVRDCYSWVDSAINVALGGPITLVDGFFARYWGCKIEWFESPESVLANVEEVLNGLLTFWFRQEQTLQRSPSARTLVVRTQDISTSMNVIADFIGIHPSTLLRERSHSRRTPVKHNLLKQLDRDLLARVFAKCENTVVMRKYYPEVTLQRFLDEPDSTSSSCVFPVGYWIHQAELAAQQGNKELMDRMLAKVPRSELEPDELRRIEMLHGWLSPSEEMQANQSLFDMVEALAVIQALASRGHTERLGYRLTKTGLCAKDNNWYVPLEFSQRDRTFSVFLCTHDIWDNQLLASKHFSISLNQGAAPATPTDERLARMILIALERRAQRSVARKSAKSKPMRF